MPLNVSIIPPGEVVDGIHHSLGHVRFTRTDLPLHGTIYYGPRFIQKKQLFAALSNIAKSTEPFQVSTEAVVATRYGTVAVRLSCQADSMGTMHHRVLRAMGLVSGT